MAKRKSTRLYDRKPTARQVAAARRKLAADGALPPEPGDPELGAFLMDILRGLERAEEVALTVAGALRSEDFEHRADAAGTLSRGCADELTEQIEQLEKAIKGVCVAGSELIVNSNKLVPSGDVRVPQEVRS